MTKDQKKFLGSKTEEDRTKKPYATPELVVHGAVDKLTGATLQGRQADGYIQPSAAIREPPMYSYLAYGMGISCDIPLLT